MSEPIDIALLRAEYEAKLYVPGQWVCPKCGFTQGKSFIGAQTGNVWANLAVHDEPCLNDGTKMERLTWEQHARDAVKMGLQQVDRAVAAEAERDALSFNKPHDMYWVRSSLAVEAKNRELEQERVGIRTALEQEFSGPGESVGDDILDAMGVFIDHHKALELRAKKLRSVLQRHHDHALEECRVCFEQDGVPIDVVTDLGEAYSESSLAEDTTEALQLSRGNSVAGETKGKQMSWNVNIVGKTADVVAAVNADAHMPNCLKETVRAFALAGTDNATSKPPGALHVQSMGHYDPNGWSNIHSFSVQPVTLAPPAPVAEPVAETPPPSAEPSKETAPPA